MQAALANEATVCMAEGCERMAITDRPTPGFRRIDGELPG